MGYTKDATGRPVFSPTPTQTVADLQAAVDYAKKFAYSRAGTKAERNALVPAEIWPGLRFYETDTGLGYQYGPAGWTVVGGDSGWLPLTLGNGWAAVAGQAPRGRLLNGRVSIEGAVQRNLGGAFSSIATIPPALLSGSKTTYYASNAAYKSGNPTATAAPTMLYFAASAGVITCNLYTAMDNSTGWILPLSGSYVYDLGN